MKFGLRYCNTGPYVDPSMAVELVQAGEAAGFDSAWTVEHTVVPADYASAYPYSDDAKMAGGIDDFPLPDPLIWMAYVVGKTVNMKFATGILILPQHNPVIIAKQVASLDYLSGGRVMLGVGVGWLKEEFDALGVPFDSRGARMEEYIDALRVLWTQEKSTYRGRFVNFDGVYCRPQPMQDSIPIIIGGHSKISARRAGRLCDGYFPARGAPADLIEEVRGAAIRCGRDPNTIEINAGMPADLQLLTDYAKLGVKRVLVPVTQVTGLDSGIRNPDDVLRWKDTISRFADL